MSQRFANKTAIVTGSGGGIGRGIARMFHAEGGNVVIADINEKNAKVVADQLGDRAIAIKCDVTSEQDIASCVEAAIAQFGQLDCMVNNAGATGYMGPVTDITEQDYRDTTDLLLFSVLMGMKHAIPHLRQTKGSIINISSITGLSAESQAFMYASSKAAVIHLTKCAALQLGEEHIRVNCIAPGMIVTQIYESIIPGIDEDNPEHIAKMAELLGEIQPLNAVGVPNDISEAAMYLASDGAGYVTGQTITIDGGGTLSCPTESRSVEATMLKNMKL